MTEIWSLAPGTSAYVEKEIVPKLKPGEYEILKQLGQALRKECETVRCPKLWDRMKEIGC